MINIVKKKINMSDELKEEYSNLMGKRENLWKRYHRAKTEDKKSEILAEINDIQSKIKKLPKSIQDNLNNFDKDLQKEKANSRSL